MVVPLDNEYQFTEPVIYRVPSKKLSSSILRWRNVKISIENNKLYYTIEKKVKIIPLINVRIIDVWICGVLKPNILGLHTSNGDLLFKFSDAFLIEDIKKVIAQNIEERNPTEDEAKLMSQIKPIKYSKHAITRGRQRLRR